MQIHGIQNISEYLFELAPEFFKENVVGAKPNEIRELEKKIGKTVCKKHKEFLEIFGGTETQKLNPFLNDRDFSVKTLLVAYNDLEETEYKLPDNVFYFSSSDVLGEEIFIKCSDMDKNDADIGDLNYQTGNFKCRDISEFESWLSWAVFEFRLSQFEFQYEIIPFWDTELEKWIGDPRKTFELLEEFGLQLVFSLCNGTYCLDGNDLSAMIFPDGSGRIAVDDIKRYRKLQSALLKQLPIKLKPVEEGWRMHAPRD